MRRDAADALAYGCTGLLGIHWRTRILGPNVSALAKAAWDQKPWNPYLGKKIAIPDPKTTEGREGGNVAAFPNNPIADTEHAALYQTVTYGMKAYRLKVPNGAYTVRLQFCEPHYGEAGKRVFGVTLQGKKVIDKLDIFATVGKNRALDYTFPGVEVSNGILEIQFDSIVEFPCIAAFVVEGQGVTRKINCGGPAVEGYEADLPQVEPGQSAAGPARRGFLRRLGQDGVRQRSGRAGREALCQARWWAGHGDRQAAGRLSAPAGHVGGRSRRHSAG